MDTTVLEMAQRAKRASRQLGPLNTATKNAALMAAPIPGELWDTLKRERLIPAHAPTPRPC